MAQPGMLFVMARVPDGVRAALLQVLAVSGLDAMLGGALYPPRNWHQSLSDLHPPVAREAMRRACTGVHAQAFEMRLDRLESSGTLPGRIHWRFMPAGGKPDVLASLLAALRGQMCMQGIADAHGHSAHITASYVANQGIKRRAFAPVSWMIDAIELVEVAGRGKHYRYEVVEAWPLQPSTELTPPAQLGLLD